MFSSKKTSVVVSSKKETELYNKPMTISATPPSTMGGGFFFPMPTGVEKGDIVYWDPTAGAASTGAWIKLDAPVESATTTEPESLTHNGQSLFWAKGLPRGTAKNQMLYWDPSVGDGGAWVILQEPTFGSGDDPAFLQFTGNLGWGEGKGGSGLPAGAIAKEFDVCENGQPRTWWFLVWENQPVLTPPEQT